MWGHRQQRSPHQRDVSLFLLSSLGRPVLWRAVRKQLPPEKSTERQDVSLVLFMHHPLESSGGAHQLPPKESKERLDMSVVFFERRSPKSGGDAKQLPPERFKKKQDVSLALLKCYPLKSGGNANQSSLEKLKEWRDVSFALFECHPLKSSDDANQLPPNELFPHVHWCNTQEKYQKTHIKVSGVNWARSHQCCPLVIWVLKICPNNSMIPPTKITGLIILQ